MRDNWSEADESEVMPQTDWLGSTPVFFDRSTAHWSTNVNDLVCARRSMSLSRVGLSGYLDFGYSILGKTPIADVNFLAPNSRLERTDKALREVSVEDPIEQHWDFRLSEADVLDLFRERVNQWEANLPSDHSIILPLSGGLDSRLLLWAIRDVDRVHAFSYGFSRNQSASSEVHIAQQMAALRGVRWTHIPIANPHDYLDAWLELFGVSTHAHGMYHYEFLDHVVRHIDGPASLLSGIVGDAWAGSISRQDISRPSDILKLGYRHGMYSTSPISRVSPEIYLEEFYDQNSEQLGDFRFQLVTTIRLKMILLSLLLRIPRQLGLGAWSPFLDPDIAFAMMNLPPERRKNRQWVRDHFNREGLAAQKGSLRIKRTNSLDFEAVRSCNPPRLNHESLATIISEGEVEEINKRLTISRLDGYLHHLFMNPRARGLLLKFGVMEPSMENYTNYLCLYPLDMAFRKTTLS